MKKILIALLFFLLIWTPRSWATTITLQDGVDSYTGTTNTSLEASASTSNFSGSASRLFGDNTVDSFLVRFDLSGIPAGATINSAVLSIYEILSGGDHSLTVYQVVRDWGGTTATYNTYDGSNSWGTVGCRNSTSDYTTTNSSATGNNNGGWVNFNVRDILINILATNNYGFNIKATNDNPYEEFAFKANSTQSLRPKLVITYTAAGGSGGDYTQDVNCNVAYPMDVDESPISDSSPNNDDATLKGAGEPDYQASAPIYYTAGSYLFDGVDDHLTVSGMASNIRPITIVSWIYPHSEGTNGVGRFTEEGIWAICMSDTDSNNAPLFYLNTTGNQLKVNSSNGSYVLNTWQHFAFTWTGGLDASADVKFYINGVETSYQVQTDGTPDLISDTGEPFYIGNRSSDNDRGFDGAMKEYAVFNRVLSQAEILNIMNYGLSGYLSSEAGPPITSKFINVNED